MVTSESTMIHAWVATLNRTFRASPSAVVSGGRGGGGAAVAIGKRDFIQAHFDGQGHRLVLGLAFEVGRIRAAGDDDPQRGPPLWGDATQGVDRESMALQLRR